LKKRIILAITSICFILISCENSGGKESVYGVDRDQAAAAESEVEQEIVDKHILDEKEDSDLSLEDEESVLKDEDEDENTIPEEQSGGCKMPESFLNPFDNFLTFEFSGEINKISPSFSPSYGMGEIKMQIGESEFNNLSEKIIYGAFGKLITSETNDTMKVVAQGDYERISPSEMKIKLSVVYLGTYGDLIELKESGENIINDFKVSIFQYHSKESGKLQKYCEIFTHDENVNNAAFICYDEETEFFAGERLKTSGISKMKEISPNCWCAKNNVVTDCADFDS